MCETGADKIARMWKEVCVMKVEGKVEGSICQVSLFSDEEGTLVAPTPTVIC